MTLPSPLRIGYRDWSVAPWPIELAFAEGSLGDCDANYGVIRVADNLDAPQEACVLFHEAFHAVWSVFGLPAKAREEDAVNALSAGFVQMWRDNPALRDYLNALA